MMMWSHDPKEGTYALADLTPSELGVLTAAVLTGFAVISDSDTFSAEAARRNLINYVGDVGEEEASRILSFVIAADAHRIQNRG